MEFENMILDTDIQVAEVDYLYKDKKIEYFVSASYGEVSWGYDNEDKKIDYYCEQVKGTDIEVTEYETPETERNRYVAEFEYKKLHYCLSGELTKEEIENILKNLYFGSLYTLDRVRCDQRPARQIAGGRCRAVTSARADAFRIGGDI